MTTYSGLRSYKIAEREAEEMRDKALFGISDAKLGTIEEVIFDTATGGIRQVVVDTKCRKRVLLPALRLHDRAAPEGAFEVDLTRSQLERLPAYDEDRVESQTRWLK